MNSDCNDWTIWPDFVTRDLPDGTSPNIPNDVCKAYAAATTKAFQVGENPCTEDCGTWLPQVAALCHSSVTKGDTTTLSRLWTVTVGDDTTILSEKDLFSLAHSAESRASNAWFLAQATGFILAVHYFSLQNSTTAQRLLVSAPWLPANGTPLAFHTLPTERAKIAAIQHVLANQAVGFFAASLRSSRAANPPVNASQL